MSRWASLVGGQLADPFAKPELPAQPAPSERTYLKTTMNIKGNDSEAEPALLLKESAAQGIPIVPAPIEHASHQITASSFSSMLRGQEMSKKLSRNQEESTLTPSFNDGPHGAGESSVREQQVGEAQSEASSSTQRGDMRHHAGGDTGEDALSVQATETVEDKVQEVDEEDQRVFEKPMNSRTARGEPQADIPQLSTVIQTVLSGALANSQVASNSSIALEVFLGKAYVDTKTVTPHFRCFKGRQAPAFAPSDFLDIFATPFANGNATTFFSRRLTSSWQDAKFIIDLSRRNAVRLFEPDPVQTRVHYRLRCRDENTGVEVVIDVHYYGSVVVQGPEESLATIKVHVPKQIWDACLNLSICPNLEQKDFSFFQPFLESLWIEGSNNEQDRMQRLKAQKGCHLAVLSAELRHEVAHQSRVDSDILINVTQIQDLVTSDPESDKFFALAYPSEEMIERGRLWYEVRLSSTKGANALSRTMFNEAERTTESPGREEIVDAAGRMFEVAKPVLERIDNVGFSSQAMAESSASQTAYSRSQIGTTIRDGTSRDLLSTHNSSAL